MWDCNVWVIFVYLFVSVIFGEEFYLYGWYCFDDELVELDCKVFGL